MRASIDGIYKQVCVVCNLVKLISNVFSKDVSDGVLTVLLGNNVAKFMLKPWSKWKDAKEGRREEERAEQKLNLSGDSRH